MADINTPTGSVNSGSTAVPAATPSQQAAPQSASRPEQSPSSPSNTAPPQQPRPCPKDCTKCGFQQHAFCAARMSFMAFDALNAILQRLDAQQSDIDDLSKKIESMQSSEAEFIAPSPIQGDIFPAEG